VFGDARRALDLLRVAAEVAERDGEVNITSNHIDRAEEKIEKNRVLEIVQTQPKQSQAVLLAILDLIGSSDKKIETGEVFEKYREICRNIGLNVLTQRRISDLISELDMLGLINAKVISKGRYGRTREIYITIPEGLLEQIKSTLREDML
jgi:cell division control protein 6